MSIGSFSQLRSIRRAFLVFVLTLTFTSLLTAQQKTESDYILRNFRFRSGESLPEMKIHYATVGVPQRNRDGRITNAILLLHGTGGSLAGFLSQPYSTLFQAGEPLDAARYFTVIPDVIGHGQSSKPSNGLRTRFPHYDYGDMVEAEYRLLVEELRVDHLRLVSGVSMGGMETWLWGEEHPDMMDALFPLVCMPTAIYGLNRLGRELAIFMITSDSEYLNGNTSSQSLNQTIGMFELMLDAASRMQESSPNPDVAEALFKIWMGDSGIQRDATDLVYGLDASRNYNPEPGLEKVRARVVAVNAADDLINPPDAETMEALMKRVKRGRFVLLPASAGTHGHSSGSDPSLWKQYLAELMR